ncbi:MAG: histidine phosphatase family protein [Candidatus Aenigmarchaeota archaeon]|nr:histidine phosphatase family protein [Candidatus Aenigmarchaeota archaeon]
MKIYLIRHGETTGDVENRYGGDYDDHLSTTGKIQCEALAKKLKNKNIGIIYHSPKIRAKETAEILNKSLKVNIEPVADLRERNNYGILTGLVKTEAKKNYPEEVAKLEKDKLHHAVKNSEDYNSFKKRVISTFQKIISGKHSVIAIISHGGPISCIFREFGFGEFERLGDCAVLELENVNGKLELVKMENAVLKK